MEHKEQLELLRQQIPIGIRHGLHLLQQTNGNIHQAQELFEKELIQVVMNKAAVSSDIAKKHLLACNYDITCALNYIDNERFSLTERILRKHKNNKDEALALIIHQIVATENIQRKFWLPLKEITHLTPLVYSVVAVHEFLGYEKWEDFNGAVFAYAEIVVVQFEIILNMPEMAYCIRAAKKRCDELFEQYKGTDASSFANALNSDSEFCEQEAFYKRNRAHVVDRLYSLVVEHVVLFP